METNTIIVIVGGLLGICVSAGSVITFWMNFSNRIVEAKGAADKALSVAEDAKKDAKEATEKATLLSAAFGLYREQIAREYIHREVMREVEDRLTAAIERLGDRLDRVLEQQRPHV